MGYGEITSEAVMAKDFKLPDKTPLFDKPLKQPNIKENKDNPELADWTVGVRWIQAMEREHAVTKPRIFANQNIVCKLRDQDTMDFLKGYFPIEGK